MLPAKPYKSVWKKNQARQYFMDIFKSLKY